jgi:hypothetical protein
VAIVDEIATIMTTNGIDWRYTSLLDLFDVFMAIKYFDFVVDQ